MSFSTLTPTVFNASELRKNRKALDAARDEGAARVRDVDGTALIVLPEGRLSSLVREHEVYELASRTSLRLRRLEHARTTGTDAHIEDWRWLRHLESDDIGDFIADMWEAVADAESELSRAPITVALEEWHEAARAAADPVRDAKLTAAIDAEEFVEISPG